MTEKLIKIEVPGNLLLTGEYAILSEGSLGIGIAIDILSRVTVQPAEAGIIITGLFGKESTTWSGEKDNSLFDCISSTVNEWREPQGYSLFKGRIEADSRNFYTSSGNKLGLGSSAAVTAGITTAMICNLPLPRQELKDIIFKLALSAHRKFQNGKGSGYDIATSTYGGIVEFTGGKTPTARPAPLSNEFSLGLFFANNPIKTPGAVKKFSDWAEQKPVAFRQFLQNSDKYTSEILSSGNLLTATQQLSDYRKLLIDLGDSIQVSALLDLEEDWQKTENCNRFIKAVGAGNEMGVLLSGNNRINPPFKAAQIHKEGITWKPEA